MVNPRFPKATSQLVGPNQWPTVPWYNWFLSLNALLDSGAISIEQFTAAILKIVTALGSTDGTADAIIDFANLGITGIAPIIVTGNPRDGFLIKLLPGTIPDPTPTGQHMLVRSPQRGKAGRSIKGDKGDSGQPGQPIFIAKRRSVVRQRAMSPGNNSAIVSLSPVGSSPNANAATLLAQSLNLEPASASFPGVVTTGTQSFAGVKTFTSPVTVPDPVAATDAVNLETLQTYLATLDSKDQCAYASTAALPANTYANGTLGVGATLTATANGPLIIDGVTTITANLGERVLVAGEATDSHNGWYTITQIGVVLVSPYILTRATPDDQAAEIGPGYLTAIEAPSGLTPGSANNGKVFLSVAPVPFVVGTSSLTFGTVGNTYTADESTLHLSGSTFSIKSTYVGQSSITTLGTIATGTWNGSVIGPAYGGTGVANNAASTITISGSFASTFTVTGATTVTFPTTGTLAVITASNAMTAVSTPSATSAGFLANYTKTLSGREMPFVRGPSGIERCLEMPEISSWHGWYRGFASAAGTYVGIAGTNAGTAAQVTPTVTNRYTMMARSTFSSVITTTNQQVGSRGTFNNLFRGAAAGIGGFWVIARFGFTSIKTGCRAFVGVTANTTTVDADPSSKLNIAGFAFDIGDTAWTFMHNDGSGTATKDAIAGQATLATNNTGFIAIVGCYPNDSKIYYALYDLVQGTWLCDTSTNTDLPVNTTGLNVTVAMSNGTANTAANDAVIGISTIDVYTES